MKCPECNQGELEAKRSEYIVCSFDELGCDYPKKVNHCGDCPRNPMREATT